MLFLQVAFNEEILYEYKKNNLNGDQMFKQIKQLMLMMATFITLVIIRDVVNVELIIASISTVTFIVITRNRIFNPGTQSIVRTITM